MAVLVGCVPFGPGDANDVYTGALGVERDADVVRVMTWNIETVGSPGSDEYDAALEIVDRLKPDVLLLNEVAGSWDADNAEWFAVDAGFAHHVVAGSEYGDDRNAILSVYPLADARGRTAAEISGDPRANDITRDFVMATVQAPAGELDVVGMHWKSGWDDTDEFRRVLEGHRAAQVLGSDRPGVLTGDWNDDVNDGSDWPYTFTSMPAGLPGSMWLGSDLWAALNDGGLPNDPFAPLLAAGLELQEIRQRSGTDATRPVSGRRLDYVATTPGLEVRAAEVFDCRDQGRSGGVEQYDARVPDAACPAASDHLPVVADLVVGQVRPSDPVPVTDLAPGELVVSELLANPDACPDETGEWVEIHNAAGVPVDLTGLELVDASGNVAVVGGGVVEAGALAVLVRGATPCGPTPTGTYDAVLSLNNGGDSLTLRVGETVLDATSYPGSGASPGRAWLPGAACPAAPTPGGPNGACD